MGTLPIQGNCAKCGVIVLPDGILGMTPEAKGMYIEEYGEIPHYLGQAGEDWCVCVECNPSADSVILGNEDSMNISDRNAEGFKC